MDFRESQKAVDSLLGDSRGACLLEKAPDAFRTISEVADDLDIPAHVLRFWETRFVQIKPMKRSGGRRYYRPDDVELLRGIRRLLYGEGYTIRGVQRILREHGIKAVQNLDDAMVKPSARSAPAFDGDADSDLDARHLRARNNGHIVHEPDVDDAELEQEDEDIEIEATAAMDFVPSRAERVDTIRPTMSRPSADIPVATIPDVAPSISPGVPSLSASGARTGAEAYAPPSIRNTVRPGGRDKLQTVLDDLLNARALIDRALRGDNRQA
jgi:DNA-binding transcriptional MerR regulator